QGAAVDLLAAGEGVGEAAAEFSLDVGEALLIGGGEDRLGGGHTWGCGAAGEDFKGICEGGLQFPTRVGNHPYVSARESGTCAILVVMQVRAGGKFGSSALATGWRSGGCPGRP